jgi:hypothetical protein
MSAPGNTALIVVMLAVFVASCAYAAGRLHQRYQTTRDREEAYRDGYDHATRSVFTLAARVIAPRRGVRGAASVRPVVDGSVVLEPVAALPAAVATAEPDPATEAAPTPAARPEPDASLGFPVPPPPSARIVAEPAAVGGVVYRPFPDPRPAEGPEPWVGEPSSMPAPRRHRAAASGAESSAEAEPSEEELAAAEPTGRHTVPDELVQAATYRLPPDRIFRAKVPDPTNAPGLPDEATTRLSVPKPRQS